jgi:hypothetical protein
MQSSCLLIAHPECHVQASRGPVLAVVTNILVTVSLPFADVELHGTLHHGSDRTTFLSNFDHLHSGCQYDGIPVAPSDPGLDTSFQYTRPHLSLADLGPYPDSPAAAHLSDW